MRCPLASAGYHAALRGGVLALDLDAAGVRVERPLVDPARVEESLVLIDGGPGRGAGSGDWDVIKGQIDADESVRQSLAEIASLARQVREALVAGRFEDVIAPMAQEWEARKRLGPGGTTPAVDRVVEIVGGAGGAAQACDGGSVVAAWAPPGGSGPGRREAVLAALREGGLRVLPARVDLRGLDVEEIA